MSGKLVLPVLIAAAAATALTLIVGLFWQGDGLTTWATFFVGLLALDWLRHGEWRENGGNPG